MSPAKQMFAMILFVLSSSAAAQAEAPKGDHVPMVHTPLSPIELLDALKEGHLKTFGVYPTKNRLAMAWGQVAFENGQGKYSYNHNLGNVGAGAADQPTYYSRIDAHFYRAFFDFADGAAAYWAVIKHCAPALAAFDVGNPQVAAMRLKNCNYFEASLEEYSKGFSSLYYNAINKLIPQEEQEDERRTQELLAAIRRSISTGSATTPAPERFFARDDD